MAVLQEDPVPFFLGLVDRSEAAFTLALTKSPDKERRALILLQGEVDEIFTRIFSGLKDENERNGVGHLIISICDDVGRKFEEKIAHLLL